MATSIRLKIGVISQLPPPVHGQTVMTSRFLDALGALAFDYRLVDRRFSSHIDEVGRPSARKLIAAASLIFRVIVMALSFRPNAIVFFVTTRPGSFLVDWLVSEALRFGRSHVVLYVHSVGFADLEARGGVWRFAVRRLFNHRVDVVTLGTELVSDIARFIPTARCTLIPNTPGSVPYRVSGDKIRKVLFLSNLIPGKGAEGFARIANRLPGPHPWRCTIAGGHADGAVVQAVQTIISGSPAWVRTSIAGPIVGRDKWAALKDASCLAFTSRLIEAQPLTIAEAFACGTPVVAFRLGGISDVVKDGVNGFLVEPDDETQFARLVAAIGTDPALRARLSSGARATFESTLSVEAYADAWSRVLHRASR